MKTCVLISGPPGSGKDETAKYISSKYNFKHFSLADPVRDIVTKLYNLESYHYFEERDLKEKNIKQWDLSPREMCQTIGEGMRNWLDEDIWCKNLISRSEMNNNIVISDNRYRNEIEFFEKYFNVITIRLKRDGCDGSKVGIKDHASENGLIGVSATYTIDNSLELKDLYEAIERIIKWEDIC